MVKFAYWVSVSSILIIGTILMLAILVVTLTINEAFMVGIPIVFMFTMLMIAIVEGINTVLRD